jgi:NADH:quinone reductase (non-electrogenic)
MRASERQRTSGQQRPAWPGYAVIVHRHRVVVIGAGFGGLAVAKGLHHAPVDVDVVDANNFHLFQPLLYQVATAGLDSDDVAYAVRGVFRGQRNVNVHMATVTAVDIDARTVTLDRGDGVVDQLPYDTLVVAAGAVSTSYGIDGVDEHTIPLKDLDDALDLRLSVLERFERAASDPSSLDRGELNVVLCGGGPTGVETAGAMMELFSRVLAKDFPNLDVRQARVVLVEAAPRLLGAMSPKSSDRALRTLSRRGVEVRVGVGVDRVTADGQRRLVHLTDGTVLPAGVVVWAAGVRANPLAEMLGVELTKGGRIVVESDLSVPGHPEVFAIGDIAASPAPKLAGVEGPGVLPQVAQPAIQGGHHVAKQIVRRLTGRPTEPFHYHDKGTMATIGRNDAVTELPSGLRLSGLLGWLAWLGLHLLYLIGFRNRANVLLNWAWNYFTYDRHSRIVAARDVRRARARTRARK